MKLYPSRLFVAVLLGVSPPCGAALNVVVSTPDLAAIVREIGQGHIEITTLTRPTEDPHFVDAKPSFIVKLNKADAIVEGGAELEIGWLPGLLDQARNPKLAAGAPGHISCHQGIQLMEVPTTLDRSKGDIHAAGNPHYMMDPVNAKIVAAHVAESFCKLDAASCATYRANLGKFNQALDAKLAAWLKLLAPYHGQRIVSYHNSWPYFSERFGVKIDVFMEPKPGIPPTPAHLKEVIDLMKAEKIRVIFVEPFLNRRTAETVARNTGALVLDVSQFPGGMKNTQDGYIQLLDQLVTSLSKALGGQAK